VRGLKLGRKKNPYPAPLPLKGRGDNMTSP
jgi:hypothetical protein